MKKIHKLTVKGKTAIATILDAELYLTEVDDIKKEFYKIVDGGRNLIFDLSKAAFISSAFLIVLVSSLKQARGNSVRMAVCGAVPQVKKVLETTGMDKLFPICDTEEEALKAVSGR